MRRAAIVQEMHCALEGTNIKLGTVGSDLSGMSATLILRETSSLGVRRQPIERQCLPRTFETAQTSWGPVRLKVAYLPGGERKIAPEYEDCRALAEAHAVPLREVYQAALQAEAAGAA